MQIVSVDVGEKNFAFCVCAFDSESSKLVVKSVVLESVKKKKTQSTTISCANLTNMFEEAGLASSCELVLIEQQVSGNTKAQKLAQHTWTYFHTKFLKTDKSVVFVPASLKTQVFLGDNALSYNERKKWSVLQIVSGNLVTGALKFGLSLEITEEAKRQISVLKKKDDVSDSILQATAFTAKTLLKK
jgi:hypothetical protein